MKVTVFTSNQARHIGLVRRLAANFDEVNAIIETRTLVPGKVKDLYEKSEVMQRYFTKMLETEHAIFQPYAPIPQNVQTLVMRAGDLNLVPVSALESLLDCDAVVVFGASYIKPPLIDLLIEKRAVNLHLGISPYYRGSACNFWASQQGNYHMVGATIHELTKGLDSGGMYCHVLPGPVGDAFELGMRAVESTHKAYVELLKAGKFDEWEPVKQNKALEKHYSKGKDFTEDVALEYLHNLPESKTVLNALAQNRKDELYIHPWMDK